VVAGGGGQVLLQFPSELASAVVAGRWAASASPAKPLLLGFRIRLLMSLLSTTLVRPHYGIYKWVPKIKVVLKCGRGADNKGSFWGP
jgi:hypothetical protein